MGGVVFLRPAAHAITTNTAPHKALIEEYCVSCHDQQTKTANIALDDLNYENVSQHAYVWEKVLRKVRTEQMPPTKLPQPKAEARAAFVTWLESALDKAAAAHPNPGRPVLHRLNRAEYSNAIRDLLAVDIKPMSTIKQSLNSKVKPQTRAPDKPITEELKTLETQKTRAMRKIS